MSWTLVAREDPRLLGDRIRLPHTILEQLNAMNAQHPYVFRIQDLACSVLEFSAPENEIHLSPQLYSVLNAETATIALANLEKGTKATLVPLSSDYLQVKDMRSLLEAHLRREYTTLSIGQRLEPINNKTRIPFIVKHLEPQNHVLCIQTDIEIDILPMDNLEIQEKPRWINHELLIKSSGNQVFEIPHIDTEWYRIDCSSTDCEVFVGLDPTPTHHLFASVEYGNNRLAIPKSDLQGPTFSVAVHARSDFTLHLTTVAPPVLVEQKVEGVECSNCYSIVPQQSLTMHQLHCSRNQKGCPICKRAFKIQDFADHTHCDKCDYNGSLKAVQKHLIWKHQKHTCDCGLEIDLDQVREHTLVCPEVNIICRYCHLYQKRGKLSSNAQDLYLGLGLTEHESECGSRTIVCQKCSKNITIKQVQQHMEYHEFQKQQQQIFKLCSNQTCYAPFWSPRHDPQHQQLIQKIALQYHTQFTKGCGNRCQNEYCFSSGSEMFNGKPLEPNQSAIKVMDLLKSGLPMHPQPKYYFCVKEDVTLMKQEALLLADCGFKLEWAVKALLETKDSQKALEWLKSNAPTLK
ncbi:ubiquitin fusion degradation protein UFD1-domain-containing protein [Gorgonomyces haynaldii]|nr:ubiquitin fusion degradation protein UFD1-domain-containing protein [Gorgonomyces haynaldii]